MRETPTQTMTTPRVRRVSSRTSGGAYPPVPTPQRVPRVGRLETPPVTFVTPGAPAAPRALPAPSFVPDQSEPAAGRALPSLGSATAGAAVPAPYAGPRAALNADPDVYLIALPTASGGYNSLEGAGRSGPIRVARPYGHLRSIRPVTLDPLDQMLAESAAPSASTRRGRAKVSDGLESLGSATVQTSSKLPAPRPRPAIVSAVEVETDAGIFRVERPDGILGHSDLAWALAHLEQGEPDPYVPLPRRQLALLLTLLPTPEDPEHPEADPHWGWAHKLRGPWERGPLHPKGRLGRLIAFDADDTGKGMHRACFELLGSEEVVWAVGVPCFRPGSVYELVPLGKGLHPSRWLHWPLAKTRSKNAPERPQWEVARVVFRVGAPRWPLAGVVEPLGPLGVAG